MLGRLSKNSLQFLTKNFGKHLKVVTSGAAKSERDEPENGEPFLEISYDAYLCSKI